MANPAGIKIESIIAKLIHPHPILIDPDKMAVSKYTTRCQTADESQIGSLAEAIGKDGFHPGKALHVHSTANGYELIAGVQRLSALRRLQYKQVLCFVYKTLTPEEQVRLDAWDNAADELHRPYHFLQEGEHYLLLQQLGWSVQKIAGLKGKGKTTVHRKIQIAKLPDPVKQLIRDSLKYRITIFEERNFRLICRLKDPEAIQEVCRMIFDMGKKAAQGNGQKLKHRQIAELILARQTQQQRNAPAVLPGGVNKYNPLLKEFRQQDTDFNLQQFAGRGSCTIPVWVLDLLVHPQISRDERDLIGYLARETFGQTPRRPVAAGDLAAIGRATLLPADRIAGVIHSLVTKGIIVERAGFLSIRDLDDAVDLLQHTPAPLPEPVVVQAAGIDESIQVEKKLTELMILKKNFHVCRQIILSRGGLAYLEAQLDYCQAMENQGTKIGAGYYVRSIKENYAKYAADAKPVTVHPARPGKRTPTERTTSESRQTLYNEYLNNKHLYNKYLAGELTRRFGAMNQDEVIALQERLVAAALAEHNTVLRAFERDKLRAVLKEIQTGEPSELQLVFYQDILNKLYVSHFQLPDFNGWKVRQQTTAAAPVAVTV